MNYSYGLPLYSLIEVPAIEPKSGQLSLRMVASSPLDMWGRPVGSLTALKWDVMSQRILAVYGPFTLKLTPSHMPPSMASLLRELNFIAPTARVVSVLSS